MLGAILGIVGSLTNLGSKMVLDKDKQAEFAFKTQELVLNILRAIATQATVPWVDATVKLVVASVILARPLGSFALFMFGLFNLDLVKQLHELGTLGDLGIATIFGSFPAWFGARELHKKSERDARRNGGF